MRALCVGSAACLEADLAAARDLKICPERGWTVIAVNKAALSWPGKLPHWVSVHAENFPRWISERHAKGLPPAGRLWTRERRWVPKGLTVSPAPNWRGSSGLLAVTVALRLGAMQVVCCGIPLDYKQGHFDTPNVPWRDGCNYRAGWTDHLSDMTEVRSMSGWTAELLGTPTAAWLAAGVWA